MAAARAHRVLPGFGLTLGTTLAFVGLLVLIPLAALVLRAASIGWTEFWQIALDERAVASYRVSFGAAFTAGIINSVAGFTIAWTLVRHDFPGRRVLDAIIDLPFALPTAVSGIALTAVFAPNGWIGSALAAQGIQIAYAWTGIVVALTLIGLPFVVRTVQPAVAEVQRDLEDAAETLGASPALVFWRISLPTVLPAILTGFALAFARGIGEYGSVIFIAGNLPFATEITPLLIVIRLEEFQYGAAAALGVVMLAASFVLLLAINLLQSWSRRRLQRGHA